MVDQLRLSCGFVDITPAKKYALAGYGFRSGVFESIADNLELNAIVLKKNNEVGIILSADLLFITDEIKQNVLSALSPEYNIKEENVFFSATHTHFAPAVDFSKPLLGEANPGYVKFIVEKAVDLIEALLSGKSIPVRVYYGAGLAHHAVNRRRTGWILSDKGFPKRGMAFLPNFEGVKDETIHTIVFKDFDNSVRAIIWNYACHPTAFPRQNDVSADFPGVARQMLRHRIDDNRLSVLFIQGFSGNIRPPALDKTGQTVKSKIKKMINGTSFGQFTLEEFNLWATSLADCLIDIALNNNEEIFPDLNFAQIKIPLSEIIDYHRSDKRFGLQKFEIASNLIIIGLSAEVVVEYVNQLEHFFPNGHIIPAGCLDSVFGYLPTQKMLEEGGYEAGGFFKLFSLEGKFNSSLERIVLANLKKLEIKTQ